MSSIISEIILSLGFLLQVFSFLLLGFGTGRFMLDSYHKAPWQVQIALVLGFFGLIVGLADFLLPELAGAFALGAGAAFLMTSGPKKKDDSENK